MGVVQLGLSPSVLYPLSIREVFLMAEGHEQRERREWERVLMIRNVLVAVNGGKAKDMLTLQKLFEPAPERETKYREWKEGEDWLGAVARSYEGLINREQ
jgi:hypothetical protein